MENHLQLRSDAENLSDQNCGVQTLEPRALKTDLLLLTTTTYYYYYLILLRTTTTTTYYY